MKPFWLNRQNRHSILTQRIAANTKNHVFTQLNVTQLRLAILL